MFSDKPVGVDVALWCALLGSWIPAHAQPASPPPVISPAWTPGAQPTPLPAIAIVGLAAVAQARAASQRATYERYLRAWSNVSADERSTLLAGSVSPTLHYLDAMTERHGAAPFAEHLAGFQQRRPGFRFALTQLLAFGTSALASWAMLDANGLVVVEGFDALRFDESGPLVEITGFSNVPALRVP